MSLVRLSIAIPTYNFGAFIGQTLESILPQATDDVEVLVVDGASTDDTGEVVRRYQERYPRLRYHLLEKKGGIDRDMATSVDLSRGDYVWLFSADDVMAEGAIKKVLGEIRSGLEVYLSGMTICSLEMVPLHVHPIMDPAVAGVFDLSDPQQRRRYFSQAVTSPAFFSFMSALVVQRARLLSVPLEEAFIGSCWGHVVRLFRLIPTGLRVKFLAEPLLLNRSGNDSFADRGMVRRIAIAVDGYDRIATAIFGPDSPEAADMRRVIRNEYTLPFLLHAKLTMYENRSVESGTELAKLVAKLYSDPQPGVRLRRAAYRLAPYPLLKFVAGIRRAIRTRREERPPR
jgi:abequosyltransferase